MTPPTTAIVLFILLGVIFVVLALVLVLYQNIPNFRFFVDSLRIPDASDSPTWEQKLKVEEEKKKVREEKRKARLAKERARELVIRRREVKAELLNTTLRKIGQEYPLGGEDCYWYSRIDQETFDEVNRVLRKRGWELDAELVYCPEDLIERQVNLRRLTGLPIPASSKVDSTDLPVVVNCTNE